MGKESIKAIIFDLDGVLVDMPDGHYEALNNALGLFGVKIEKAEHYAHFNGLPTRKKVEELERMGRLPSGLGGFINDIKQIYTKKLIPKLCPPDYSKIILLRSLKERGYKLACCSNSTSETLYMMLASAGLLNFFDFTIGNDQVNFPKPDPEMYILGISKMGVRPEEVIIVEDSAHGIAAAKASGAIVYEVRNTNDVHLALFDELLT